ncbi:T9SS type A sorting domain-containing protein [Ulvibacter antarcticus]|uniref:Putative secreted protein (Por secretion system target) n=1 Tax=Ulvibacter antarcticus TaxID=442714 RepID=A0A3L9Z685_9FLAO|nr:T9SS type A sorting domain-containing protein [Ulvibacter antarcticus]RMA65785.1 putative secreted protein (Por secretion system target) [Ulvibacter antarcticus]
MKTTLLLACLFCSTLMSIAQTPANDECVNRLSISVTTASVSSYSTDLTNATESTDSSCVNPSNDNVDVWFEFTMPVDGNVRVTNTSGSDNYTFYDSCGGAEIECFNGNDFVYSLSASTAYVLRVSRNQSVAGVVNFNLQAFETLANDECIGKTPITVTTGGVSSYSVDLRATTESLDGSCDGAASNNYLDAWYEFTMPVNGNFRVTNLGGITGITLYDSCGGTEISCFYGNGFVYNLTASTTYIMRVTNRAIYAGVVNFNLEAFETLANDECVDRTPITVTTGGVSSYSVDLRAATESLDGSCDGAASNNYLDAWYEFTMPVDGNIRVTNTGGITGITLYDSCGGTEISCFYSNGFVYNLTASTTYIMRVTNRSIYAGVVNFNLEAFETLANDECVDRTPITVTTGGVSSYSVDLRAATESLDGSCDGAASNNYLDAWYEFTMPVNGNIRVTNIGGITGITLYDSCGGTEISCFYSNGFVYNLTASTTYVLRVTNRAIYAGVVNFNLEAFETLANDECVDRTPITVTTGGVSSYSVDLRAATESLDGSCDGAASNNYLDAWYEFSMPVNGNFRVTNIGGITGITLYDSCGGTEISCFYSNGFVYNLTASTTYIMRVTSRSIYAGVVNFNLEAFETAANDECVNATEINVGTVDYSEIANDSRTATESLDGSCDGSASNTYLDLWYEFVMPVNGNIQISNISGSDGVAMFDSCGGAELDCFYGNGLFFNLVSGTTYYLRVTKRSIYANLINFRIKAIEAPLAACATTTQFIGGAWDNGDPDISTNVIIRSNYNTATHGSFTSCSLAIDSGITLTVSSERYVEVAFGIDNNGTLNVEHQGNLVQRDVAALAINNGAINVHITTPVLKPRDFMVLGSPMDTETRADVFGNAFRVLHHTTANFVPDATVAAAFPNAENFADDNGDNWSQYTGIINPSEGFLVWPQPNISSGNTSYNLTYSEGTLNNGDIEFPVVFNTTKNDSPNILANPYASAISAPDFINQNAMVDEVYFWEHLTTPNSSLPGYLNANFSMEDISMFNLMGGIAAASDPSGTDSEPNGFIATSQGFGIKATASGTALFTNSMRRLSNNNTLRFNDLEVNRIWLSVQNRTYNMQNTALIGFSEEATAGIDNGFDSRRLATIVSLYSHLEDGTGEFGIQSRENFSPNSYIPLGFSTQIEVDEGLPYIISIANIEGSALETSTVYLIDTYMGITTNLTESVYQFMAAAGTYNNRFILQFKPELLETSDANLNAISMYPNPASDLIEIRSPTNVWLLGADIYDTTGRLLMHSNLEEIGGYNTIDVSGLSSATYFVVLESSAGTITKQLIKE